MAAGQGSGDRPHNAALAQDCHHAHIGPSPASHLRQRVAWIAYCVSRIACSTSAQTGSLQSTSLQYSLHWEVIGCVPLLQFAILGSATL